MTETNSTEAEKVDETPWYAIRTFNCQEQKVVVFFEVNHFTVLFR